MESLNLSDLLRTNPELILDDTFLKFLLQNVTFRQFIAEVIAYPDIYESLSTKQQFWENFFQDVHPVLYSDLTNKLNVNWFYELLQEDLPAKKYYYDDFQKEGLAYLAPDFKPYPPKEAREKNYEYYGDIPRMEKNSIKEGNLLPFSDIKDIKFAHRDHALILFENGDLYEFFSTFLGRIIKNKVTLSDIKKIINVGESDVFLLTKNGRIMYPKFGGKSWLEFTAPFKIKNIQADHNYDDSSEGDIYFSVTDYENNTYLLSAYLILNPKEIVWTPLFTQEYSMYELVHIRETGVWPGTKRGRISSYLYYIDSNNLYMVKYLNFVQKENPIKIVFPDQIKVSDFLYIPVHDRFIFKDTDGFFYHVKIGENTNAIEDIRKLGPMDGVPFIDYFYIKTESEPATVFFINANGKIYALELHFSRSPSAVGLRELRNTLPGVKKIFARRDYGFVMEKVEKVDHVLIPYFTYLLYLTSGKIVADEVKDGFVYFTVPNSRYKFYSILSS